MINCEQLRTILITGIKNIYEMECNGRLFSAVSINDSDWLEKDSPKIEDMTMRELYTLLYSLAPRKLSVESSFLYTRLEDMVYCYNDQ